ncbi:hypothetical protein FRC00_013432 [Tulasnella sp. 408]|nr:hypothetical protein FRC00_013432 [Tulasnella sp. 408]
MRTHLCDLSVNIPDREDLSLKFTKLLERRTGLVGRATLVYRAELQREGKTEDVVLKSSWQHVARKSESTILTTLHPSSQTLGCIARFFHGWEQQGATGSSRRARFGEPITVAHDRALRYTITEYLNPINELSQPFHIPHIGWSVLQAIKFLNGRGWFHRDISIGNMGFAIEPECKGVLVKLHDFDLSKQHGSVSRTSHWTGTLPFMSIELLRNPQMEHMIGFDMEALLWTLLWIVRVYTDGKIMFKVENHPLIRWFSPDDLRTLASNKQDYLRNPEDLTNTWYSSIEPELYQLVLTWYKMREEQQEARLKTRQFQLLLDTVYGMEGFIRIEDWMKANEQQWNSHDANGRAEVVDVVRDASSEGNEKKGTEAV